MKEAAQGENWKRDSARAGRKGKNNVSARARERERRGNLQNGPFIFFFIPFYPEFK
jgi:hypothetical protein